MITEANKELFFEWLCSNQDKIERTISSGNDGVVCFVPIPENIYLLVKDVDNNVDVLNDICGVMWDKFSDYVVNRHWCCVVKNQMLDRYEFLLEIEFTHEYSMELKQEEANSNYFF